MIIEIHADDLLTMESKGFRDIKGMLSRHIVSLAGEVDNAVLITRLSPDPEGGKQIRICLHCNMVRDYMQPMVREN